MNAFTRIRALMLALSFLCCLVLEPTAFAIQKAKSGKSELAGTWKGEVRAGDSAMGITLELKNEGEKLTGQLINAHGTWAITEVKFVSGKWTIAWRTPEGGAGKMIGTVNDNKLAGDWDNSPAFVGTFELTRTN